MPRSAQARKIAAVEASARSQASTLCCWEPTWNEMPCGTRPLRCASSIRSVAYSGSQPNLRDSGHSDPEPSQWMRQITRAPGAARATFSISASQSTANSVTPSAKAAAISLSFLIVLP